MQYYPDPMNDYFTIQIVRLIVELINGLLFDYNERLTIDQDNQALFRELYPEWYHSSNN